METEYIIGLASIVIGLIGVIYRYLHSGVKENKDKIEKHHEKFDGRLDEVEKDIVKLKK